jgi:hypothetical protein
MIHSGTARPPSKRRLGGAVGTLVCAPFRPLICVAIGAAAWAFVGSTGCAPYRIGTDSLYSCNIRTVYVPVFESNSFRRGLGERLTEAVQKEIERRTPYKVVGSPNADSILTGRILTEAKGVSVEVATDEPRELQYYFTLQLDWKDKDGVELQPMQPIPVPSSLVTVFNNNAFYPELGQSITTAQQETIDQLARQIVGFMEAPW